MKTPLPSDYKAFIARYGAGNVGDFIHLWSPFTDAKRLGLLPESKAHLDVLRGLRHTKIPHPLYPEKGGLLPWARTDNGDVLMWLTKGRPDQWTVVITDSSDFYDTDYGFVEFLSRFVDKKLGVPAFPEDVPGKVTFYAAS